MAKIQVTENELRRIIKESVEAVLDETQDEVIGAKAARRMAQNNSDGGTRKRHKKPVTLQGKTREAARKVQSTINQGINRAQRNVQQNLNTAKNVAGQACDGLGYYAGRAASKVANGFNRGYTGGVNEGVPDGEFQEPKFMQTASTKPEETKPAKKQTVGQKVRNGARKVAQTFKDARAHADSLANANRMSDNPMTRIGQGMMDSGYYPGKY